MNRHPHPPDLHRVQRGQLVVAYDGSAAARTALAHAADLADLGGVVTVVNVIAYQAISARIATLHECWRIVTEPARSAGGGNEEDLTPSLTCIGRTLQGVWLSVREDARDPNQPHFRPAQ